jgi:hypothetical protein
VHEKLVADICSLKKSLDTKETNFFLSILLTGALTSQNVLMCLARNVWKKKLAIRGQ